MSRSKLEAFAATQLTTHFTSHLRPFFKARAKSGPCARRDLAVSGARSSRTAQIHTALG
jgi:hypothetical protein